MTLLRPVVADTPPPARVAEIATTTQPDVGTPPDAEALFKEARQRRRRRRLTGALALGAFAAVVALVAGSLWLPAPSPPAPGTAPAARDAALAGTARAPMPNEIVGWGANANLVVISTRTGDVERTLASHVSVFAPGLPSVSVAPNGTVFFESATPQLVAAAATGGDRILSVSIRGGPVRDLGAGSDPQVSPDGRSVAYIAPEPAGTAGEPPYLVPPQGIDVATLSASGTVAAVRTLEPGPAQVDQGASDLSWSPNGRMLSFDLLNPTTSATTAWTTPVGRGVKSLATARRIPLAAGLTWTGFAGRVGPTNASQTRGDIGEGIGLLSSRVDSAPDRRVHRPRDRTRHGTVVPPSGCRLRSDDSGSRAVQFLVQ